MKLAAAVRRLADARGTAASQVALAWLLQVGDDVVPIPGTKHRSYLEENVAAAELRLTADEVAALDGVARESGVSGSRYNDRDLDMLNR